MKRKATKLIFADGALRYPGDVWDASRPWKYTEAVQAAAPAAADEDQEPGNMPTRKEMMAQLDQAGVEYNKRASAQELKALLDQAVQVAAPAASGAPPKSLEGTGNQEVI